MLEFIAFPFCFQLTWYGEFYSYSNYNVSKRCSTSDTHWLYLNRKWQMNNCTTKNYIVWDCRNATPGARNRSKLLPPKYRHLTEDLKSELQSPEISYRESHLWRAIQIINQWITLRLPNSSFNIRGTLGKCILSWMRRTERYSYYFELLQFLH